MNNLRRDSAPISANVWKEIDEAVMRAARHVLTGRRIATFDGPKGWDHLATRTGGMTPCAAKEGTAVICVPEMVLLAEVRAEFSIAWAAVEVFERGAPSLDTAPAEAAGREVAMAEDRLVLYGDPIGQGFFTARPSSMVTVADWSKPGQALADVLKAVEALDRAGIGRPYELVLPVSRYYAFLQAVNDGGYPAGKQLKSAVETVHRSFVVRDAGALVSTRGGDLILTVGGDLAVGYRTHDAQQLHFFCVETLASQTVTPEAVCLLKG